MAKAQNLAIKKVIYGHLSLKKKINIDQDDQTGFPLGDELTEYIVLSRFYASNKHILEFQIH